MKSIYPIIFISLAFFSCLNQAGNKGEITEDSISDSGNEITSGSDNEINSGDLALLNVQSKIHYYVDAKTGLVVYQKEFPSDWDIVTKPIYNLDTDFPVFLYRMQNNNGMKSFNTLIEQFVSFQNPQYAQEMGNYGMSNIRAVVSPTDFLENEIRPMMEREGFKLLGPRKFPEILSYIENQKKKYGMPNMDLNVYSTEWINKDNVKALVSFNQMVLNPDPSMYVENPMTIWNYQMGYFFAPEGNYEADLNTAIQADLNKTDSSNWQKYQAQVNNFRQQQQTAQHEERMRNQQQQFDQHQQMMKERYAANDANNARYMDNLRGTPTSTGYTSDSNHQNFIDMIREEQNVSLEGKTFKVEAGSENYWMNSDGKYITSNSQFYDPNRDPIYDNRHWDLTTKQK
ncbi:MAG: hypothetical protein ABIO60_05480 [Aquaticitalea sp.]